MINDHGQCERPKVRLVNVTMVAKWMAFLVAFQYAPILHMGLEICLLTQGEGKERSCHRL